MLGQYCTNTFFCSNRIQVDKINNNNDYEMVSMMMMMVLFNDGSVVKKLHCLFFFVYI